MVFKYSILAFFLLLFINSNAQQNVPYKQSEKEWVDSIYNSLTVRQRIGQLFMLRANSVVDSFEIKKLSLQIDTFAIGGLCFFKGGPVRQAILTNYYQKRSKVPLFISMDAEWGLGMRLDSTISFPRQMTIGAIKDEHLITEYGFAIAAQLKRLGVHMSFSPVADINNNPRNPVINIRSFGENKEDVARKAILYMQALKAGGIFTVAKHFPGHGDTDTDSHFTLPVINHSYQTIDSLELYPFKQLIKAGVDGMMVGHMYIPAIDSAVNMPSSLSKIVIQDLLNKKLDFKGIVITDALEMKGVSNFATDGLLELKALQAGNDILLLPESLEKGVLAIEKALQTGELSADDLEFHCKKILRAKYNAGLWQPQQIELQNIYSDLHHEDVENLNLKLYQNAITVITNQNSILPLAFSDTLSIASITFGTEKEGVLQSTIDQYARVTHLTVSKNPTLSELIALKEQIAQFNLLLLNIVNTIPSPKRNFGINKDVISFIDSLINDKKCIVSLFTLPYAVDLFKNCLNSEALLVAYQDNADAYKTVVQTIFGASSGKGTLPVAASASVPYGKGIFTSSVNCLRENPFEFSGFLPADFAALDSIVQEGIIQKAYPGGQLLVAKSGNVVYNKTFGSSDYTEVQKVKPTDLYDLASLTKIAATTIAMMKLYDEGHYHLDDPIANTLKILNKTNKQKITFREVLAHQAGLIAWIPFFKETIRIDKPDSTLYNKEYSSHFPVVVADSMFLRYDYPSWIIDSIAHSPLMKKEYRYSDLGFILLKEFVETITGMPLDMYVEETFYKPLGLNTMCFKPLELFSEDRIMPTEKDTLFRNQVIRGYVHDQAAAMLGGVSGHAGLFGNAWDLAVIIQMILQNGSYGGVEFIKPETVKLFTKQQFKGNRRALGFDKPQLIPSEPGPACEFASSESFGHTGFTGTYFWADPKYDLLIVFLTNRVYPNAEPNTLVKMGTRTALQKACYEALKRNSKKNASPKRKPVNSTDQ